MDYNPLDSQPPTYKIRNSNPEIIRKHKSEESIVDRNRLSVYSSSSDQKSFIKSADVVNINNRNSDTVIHDKYSDIYNRNLRKSIESISSGKGYEPVYKNYRYQPQFKPITGWASTQRHLTLPDSRSNLSLSTMSSYKSFSSNTEIYDNNSNNYRLSNESGPPQDDDFSTTKTDSIEFKPRISKLYSKAHVSTENNTKVLAINRDSEDYDTIVQNQGLIAYQLNSMFSTMKKNEDEPAQSPELKSLNRRSVTIDEGKNTEFNCEDEAIYATIDKTSAANEQTNKEEDVVITYPLRESIQRVVDGVSIYSESTTEVSVKPVAEQSEISTLLPEIKQEEKIDEPQPNTNEPHSNGIHLPWKWKKKSFKKGDNVVINLQKADKYSETNIPKFLVTCVKCLHDRDLLRIKGIYRLSPGFDFLKSVMKSAIYDRKYTDIENSTDGILLAGLIKAFFKNLSEPLLKSDVIDSKLDDEDFKDKLIVSDLENDMIDELIAIVDSLNPKIREIFLFFVIHIKAVEKFKSENHMDYPNLARILSPCLFNSKEATSNFDMFILTSNQSMLLQVILENYRIIFKPELQDKIAAIYDSILHVDETNAYITDSIQLASIDSTSTVNENQTNTNSTTSNGPTRFTLNFLKPKHSTKKTAAPSPPVVKVAKSNSKKSKAPPVPITIAADGSSNLDATHLNQSSEDLLKENFSFIRNKKINIETVSKQLGTNIPELIFTIVQTLTVQKLNGNEYLYQKNMNNEEMKEFIDMLKRQNEDELKRFNNGCHLAYFLKEYVKLFDPPLLSKPLPDLQIYQQMTNDAAKVNIEFIKYTEYINWIEPGAAKDTFVFLIKHLNDVATLYDENKMSSFALAKIWSQCFFGVKSDIDEQLAQIQFLDYSIVNYKKMFDAGDMNMIAAYYEKAFYDPMNLPLPANEKNQQCCSIS